MDKPYDQKEQEPQICPFLCIGWLASRTGTMYVDTATSIKELPQCKREGCATYIKQYSYCGLIPHYTPLD